MHGASLDAQPADGPCACLGGDSDAHARRRARQHSHGRSCLVASIIRSSSRSQVSSIHHACTARMAGRQCGAGQCPMHGAGVRVICVQRAGGRSSGPSAVPDVPQEQSACRAAAGRAWPCRLAVSPGSQQAMNTAAGLFSFHWRMDRGHSNVHCIQRETEEGEVSS